MAGAILRRREGGHFRQRQWRPGWQPSGPAVSIQFRLPEGNLDPGKDSDRGGVPGEKSALRRWQAPGPVERSGGCFLRSRPIF